MHLHIGQNVEHNYFNALAIDHHHLLLLLVHFDLCTFCLFIVALMSRYIGYVCVCVSVCVCVWGGNFILTFYNTKKYII